MLRLLQLGLYATVLVALGSCNDFTSSSPAKPLETGAETNATAEIEEAQVNSLAALRQLALAADPDSRATLDRFTSNSTPEARRALLEGRRSINEKQLALMESAEKPMCGRRLCEIHVVCPPREYPDDTPGVPKPGPSGSKVQFDPDDIPLIGLRLCRIERKDCEEGPVCEF